jgi:CMP/dCMP kinase
MVIAVDGPAGAGKSSVAKATAARLGFTYLDTGAMYRCVALAALRLRPDGDLSTLDLGAIAATVTIDLGVRTTLDGEDVSEAIRTQAVSQNASKVAADSAVRRAMVSQQRQLMASGDWVAEGRDIGTVVKPDAELKIYLTATTEERARRRAAQSGGDYATVLTEQRQRDERDMTRSDSPLKPAPGSVELDTTGLSLEQVVDRIVALTRASAPGS